MVQLREILHDHSSHVGRLRTDGRVYHSPVLESHDLQLFQLLPSLFWLEQPLPYIVPFFYPLYDRFLHVVLCFQPPKQVMGVLFVGRKFELLDDEDEHKRGKE